MRSVAALLAAVLAGSAMVACGDDGAEPGAPAGVTPAREATLVLDFQPNAVHTGIYAAERRGYFDDEGVDLRIQEPGGTADGAKLLEAGRADFAILDINDFGIARQRGLEIAAVAAIVQRPLASVIAADETEIRTVADLAGKTVGVTGVPSDDAVLDTVLAQAGLAPDAVKRQTIGFQSVPLLAAGRIDAATAFWNAEGVALRQRAIPTREFRVDGLGAPRYPELVLVAPDAAAQAVIPEASADQHPSLICSVLSALEAGYDELERDPDRSLDALLETVPELPPEEQRAQLSALVAARAFSRPGQVAATAVLEREAGARWLRWASDAGVVDAAPGSATARAIEDGFKPLTVSCGTGGRLTTPK